MRMMANEHIYSQILESKLNSRGFFGIVLINPKDHNNVGQILRSAKAMGASYVVLSGSRYTKRAPTDVHNAVEHMPIFEVDDPFQVIPKNAKKIAVDLLDDAEALPTIEHPNNATYFFGPEDGYVPKDVLAQCDQKVLIPTWACLNLAVCASIVMYDRLKSRYV